MPHYSTPAARAFATVCVASLSADGTFDDVSRARAHDGLRRCPATNALDARQHADLLANGERELQTHGLGPALQSAARCLSGRQREETFAWACELAVGSGRDTQDAGDRMEHIRDALEVSPGTLDVIWRSAALRYNRPGLATLFAPSLSRADRAHTGGGPKP